MSEKCKIMPTKEYLEEEYICNRKTLSDIGIENGVTTASVLYWMKKYDIQTRKQNNVIHPHAYTESEIHRISKIHKGKIVSSETRKRISESKRRHGVGFKKKRHDGYISVYYPSHPDSNRDGMVMEHRLVMENHIGRRLLKNEVVHHIDHNRSNNDISNLILMTFEEHAGLHMKERQEKRRNLL